jgi:hypothetical protein
MSGWIKLHRSITEWEWYCDLNVSRVFIHLLLTANHKPRKWQGTDIDRGQRIGSYESIAKETRLSVRQVRTAIDKLKNTGELTSKATNKYTLLTIENYELYQDSSDEATSETQTIDKQATSKRQASDKRATTNKNVKNVNNEKNANNEKNLIQDNIVAIAPKRGKPVIDFHLWPRPLTDEELQSINANRKAKRSPVLSQKTADLAIVEIRKACAAGFIFDDCIDEWIARGWIGFKADWLMRDKKVVDNTAELEARYNQFKEQTGWQ